MKITDIENDYFGRELSCIRVGSNETAVALFTNEVEFEHTHYCAEEGVKGYHKCEDQDCLLCKIGKDRAGKYLMPVYSFHDRSVMVLPVSDKMPPSSLLPQILPLFNAFENRKDGWKTPVFIKRNSYVYTVTTGVPPEDTGDLCAAISYFQENYQEGDLGKVAHQRMSREELLMDQQIREKAMMKGIPVDDFGCGSPLEIVGEGSRGDGAGKDDVASVPIGETDIPSEEPYLEGFA